MKFLTYYASLVLANCWLVQNVIGVEVFDKGDVEKISESPLSKIIFNVDDLSLRLSVINDVVNNRWMIHVASIKLDEIELYAYYPKVDRVGPDLLIYSCKGIIIGVDSRKHTIEIEQRTTPGISKPKKLVILKGEDTLDLSASVLLVEDPVFTPDDANHGHAPDVPRSGQPAP